VRGPLHNLLRASAQRWPGRAAVVADDRTLTYAELDARSNRLANLLRAAGVRTGDRVGIHHSRSAAAIEAVYASLKAGAAYVPLDPTAPMARLLHVVRDCEVRHVLTTGEAAPAWRQVAASSPVEWVVTADAPEIDAQPDRSPDDSTTEDDLAYILYTSGSTGVPKGVVHTHRSGLAFVSWARDVFQVTPEDVLSNHAPLHFDLSVFDVFAAAAAGAAVVPLPARVTALPVEAAAAIARHGITIWYSVPSALCLLGRYGGLAPGALPRLRQILFAGEVFPVRHLAHLMRLVPHVRFANLYGPTETNVCTWHPVSGVPEPTEAIPIGRPVTGVEVIALTDDGRAAADGEVGTLHVRGATVMRGYWGDPDRTRRAMVAVSGPGGPAYRTGDLVRRDADGVYWFLGRRDSQVKSRGHRIELGDVEAALLEHPAVVECAVVPVPDEMLGCQLVGWVAADGDLAGPDLARFCAQRLPGYMVPTRFQLCPALPRTSSGKIDRRRLADELTAVRPPG